MTCFLHIASKPLSQRDLKHCYCYDQVRMLYWTLQHFVILTGKKYLFHTQKAIFLGAKGFSSKIKIYTFEDAGHNLNGAPNMSYSKSSPNYVVVDKSTDRLTYCLWRFIFMLWPTGGALSRCNTPPPKYLHSASS